VRRGNPAVELEILARSNGKEHARDLVEIAFKRIFEELPQLRKDSRP